MNASTSWTEIPKKFCVTTKGSDALVMGMSPTTISINSSIL